MAVTQPDSTWGPGRKVPAPTAARGARMQALVEQVKAAEKGRLVVWSPLLLVLGIWTYFTLPVEPLPAVGLALLAAGAAVVALWRHNGLAVIAAIVAIGFGSATLRTLWVATPLLAAFTPGVTVEGYVRSVDVRGTGRIALVLDVTAAEGLPADEVPRRVRLNISSKAPPPRIGDAIRLKADLAPLPRPAAPGLFDYGRSLYFESVGATGRSKAAWETLDLPVPLGFQVDRAFHGLRTAIGARIGTAIKWPLASVADALITGERAAIPRAMNESLQASGLYHILSISGLHMSLVAGGAFWLARALLALSPALALNRPIKKWAAAVALVVGLAYMLLADSGAATERSFLMIAVVLFAVMVDRPALSLHNLAVAAIIILLTAPEQALAASFQMSFMAVMGLAAFFTWWRSREREPSVAAAGGPLARWASHLAKGTAAALATSLIAGLLSTIPALHHFGRMAPYSVVANALALPIVSLLVMPMAMISVLVMPLGLEGLPLKGLELGLRLLMLVSDTVAGWPRASFMMPQLTATTAALASLCAAMLCLPASRLRWLALPLAVATGVSFANARLPDLLVDERAATVALRTDDGLVPAHAVFGAMSATRWLRAEGDRTPVRRAAERPAWTCAAGVCTATIKGKTVAYLQGNGTVVPTCPQADIVIARMPLRRSCKGQLLTIDRFDVWRSGAYAITLKDGAVVRTVRESQGNRPWVYQPRARAKTATPVQQSGAWRPPAQPGKAGP